MTLEAPAAAPEMAVSPLENRGSEAEVILETRGVSKRFDSFTAVSDVSWRLRLGEAAGIIGPNGAGKTTFFNLLTGMFPPNQGSIHLRGEDVTRCPAHGRVLRGLGARVIANDMREAAELGRTAEQVRALGAELVCGGHDPKLFTSVDRIVLSPGVPPMPALDAADAAGVPVAGEIEMASWFVQGELALLIMLSSNARRLSRPSAPSGHTR